MLVLDIWFILIQLTKTALGYAKTLSEANWLSTLEHLLHSSEIWRSIHTPAVAVSDERYTYLSYRPKTASFSEDI